jgi:hypothetical protein
MNQLFSTAAQEFQFTAHDAGLLALALFLAIALAGVWRIERWMGEQKRAEQARIDANAPHLTPAYHAQGLAESRFWDSIKEGPNRLTEREIERESIRLASIRNQGVAGPHAVLEAKRDIERHVSRAI